MNPSDVNSFKKALGTILESFSAKEKFLTSHLAARMSKAAQENPGDQTIIGVAAYLGKRADKEPFISRAELNTVYSKLYTSSSRCEAYLEKELCRTHAEPKVAKLHHDINENEDFYHKNADQNLVAALTSVFNKEATIASYSDELGAKAATACLRELNKLTFKPTKVSALAGNEYAIICQASYETPKGECGVLIPVEIMEGRATLPSLFVSAGTFENISEDSVKDYILRTAGIKIQANVKNILDLIKVAKKGVEPVDELEQIVVRASARKGTPAEYDSNAIFLTLQAEPKVIETKANAEEVNLFASKLASEGGQAEFLFGKQALDVSKALILKTVKSAGMINPQIKISSFDAKTVYFVASASNGAVKVPVKIENGKAEYPSIAMASGEVESFDRDGIAKLLTKDDHVMAAHASSLNAVKPSQLINVVIKAAQDKDYAAVEEALNVLDQSGDKVAFATAVQAYQDVLKGVLKTASVHKCSMERKTPNSIHPVCGHTNLPVTQVYQDENGQCRAKSRQHENHTNEGGSFMHSSVYIKS